MRTSTKRERIFLLGFIVGCAVLLLSIFKVQATLTDEEESNAPRVEASRGPNKPAVALTSNPRQVLDASPVNNLDPANLQSCGLASASLSDQDKAPFEGPLECIGQSAQTITESFHGIFTYSGGRVSWWIGYDYGTIVNSSFAQECSSPPLVITANRPMSYWKQDFVGCHTQTVTFTTNTGQTIQKPCSFNQASAEFFGSNITQVTITGSPNNWVFLQGNTFYIEDTACACPSIPVVP